MATKSTESAVAVIQDAPAVVVRAEDIIETRPVFLSLDRENAEFVLNETGDSWKTLEGVILDCRLGRRYYAPHRPLGSGPADCYSRDGVTGTALDGQTKECASCPLAQWGSGPTGTGQACKLRAYITLAAAGLYTPVRIALPTASVKNLNAFVRALRATGRNPEDHIIAVQAVSAMKGPAKYAEVKFALRRALTEQERQTAQALRERLAAAKAATRDDEGEDDAA